MRPATPHHTITLHDGLVVGGHFFCDRLFSRTLDALVIQQFTGRSTFRGGVNHSGVHVVLFKTMQTLAFELRTENYTCA